MLGVVVSPYSGFLSVKVVSAAPVKLYAIFLMNHPTIAIYPKFEPIDSVTDYTVFYSANHAANDSLVICYGAAQKLNSELRTMTHRLHLPATHDLDLHQLQHLGWKSNPLQFNPYCVAGFVDHCGTKLALSGDLIIAGDICYSPHPFKSDLVGDRSALLIKLGRLQEQLLNLEEMELPDLIPRIQQEIDFLQHQLQLHITE